MLADRCCKTCGCGGRWTRNAILKIITWSFSALRIQKHPSLGPWREVLKGVWAHLANQDLNIKGQIAHFGADWEAIAESVGTRRWNHTFHPCGWCGTNRESMHDHSSDSAMLTHNDWEAAKRACQVTIRLTPPLADLIFNNIAPDLRIDGSKGFALTRAIGNQMSNTTPSSGIRGSNENEPKTIT